jgi:hypothetical protein
MEKIFVLRRKKFGRIDSMTSPSFSGSQMAIKHFIGFKEVRPERKKEII